jgi:DNA modification methylase
MTSAAATATPAWRNQILVGDALERLRELPNGIAHCCVTSPPYWLLRDYGVSGQIGLESTPEEYVARLVEVFREVRRVLHASGTLWIVIGDTYASGGPGGGTARSTLNSASKRGYRPPVSGLKPKDLTGIPWMLAFALRADGWFLRSEIIWAKPTCMPDSVSDRPTRSHETLFLFAKSATYFYDYVAIREPEAASSTARRAHCGEDGRMYKPDSLSRNRAAADNREHADTNGRTRNPAFSVDGKRNRRTVWTVQSAPFADAHFAVFPQKLIEPCILGGTSERGACASCGEPMRRIVERVRTLDGEPISSLPAMRNTSKATPSQAQGVSHLRTGSAVVSERWETCDCNAGTNPCVVLDPFLGAGTTALVALRAGRDFCGVELNPTYVEMARERIDGLVRQGRIL